MQFVSKNATLFCDTTPPLQTWSSYNVLQEHTKPAPQSKQAVSTNTKHSRYIHLMSNSS